MEDDVFGWKKKKDRKVVRLYLEMEMGGLKLVGLRFKEVIF